MVDSNKNTLTFHIDGLDCADEIAILQREVGPLMGDSGHLQFNVFSQTMVVDGPPPKVSPATIIQVVARTGLRARLVDDLRDGATREDSFWKTRRRSALTAMSGAGILLAYAINRSSGGERLTLLTKAVLMTAIVAGSWFVVPKAWAAVRRLRADMNLLMMVAVIGAIFIGEWFEAATVTFLFSLSLLLESWSVDRARRAVAALMDLSPPMARLLAPNGESTDIAADEVPVGSQIVIRPGERLPLDGEVVRGTSEIDQSPITGESVPVEKSAGAAVFAGTINGDGVLLVRTSKRAEDTTLAKIIRMVSGAQSKRGPSEQWVEKFARVYTPAVMALATLVLVVPPIAFGASWELWLYRALVLLVIACPCALVISTPVSIVAGLTAAARHGVLIKGGTYLEAPAHLKAIAFDKTGTLTRGKPQVVAVVPLSGHSERELVEIAAALERNSEHPIAKAIVKYAEEQGISPIAASDFKAIKGKGAKALLHGRSYWLGSHRYLEERRQETQEMHARLEKMSERGRSVVVIGDDEHVCGMITLADEVRPEASATLSALRASGIEKLIMLTGDNRPTARDVAERTGVDEVLAELLPEDKVSAMEALVARYKRVAMVGDGVNDAPALARATVGIAMGAGGTDAAIETADIALMSDDLSKLPWLIRHSRRTLQIVRQNIAFSLTVKALFLILTLAGYASLWAAIAADTGASLLVVFNGLRLLRTHDALGIEGTARVSPDAPAVADVLKAKFGE
jgi:Cd2+/Zn2+-exporting ATPase